MNPLHVRLLALFLLLPLAALAQAPAPAPASTVLARGVEYRHLQTQSPAGEPWSIHVLEVSRKEKSIELRAVPGHTEDGAMQRELPTAMANRVAASGENVLAVVNGDYDLGLPYLGIPDGLSVTSGQMWTTGRPAWPTMAILRSREPVIAVAEARIELSSGKHRWPLSAVNKPFGTTWGSGPRLYTREFGAAVRSQSQFAAVVIGQLSPALPLRADGDVRGVVLESVRDANEVAIPPDALVVTSRPSADGLSATPPIESLKPGDRVRIRIRTSITRKKGVQHAIGGFPILVENGRRSIVGTPGENLKRRHPRTAICTNDRKIVFVVVDGRQPQLSVGMTLEELADLMVSLGCTTAMNTDGGGSSVMAIASSTSETERARHAMPLRIVNSPSDGQERGRGNAWVILRRR